MKMSLTERDFIFLYYITFANCVVGLVYIFILIIFITIVISKYKVKKIKQWVDITVEYKNNFRLYEKNETVIINKGNKRLQQINHSFRAVDKTYSKPNDLLLETIVEIDGKKQYSDERNIENTEILSDSGDYFVRGSYEITTKQLIFDGNGKIIKRLKTTEKVDPIQLTEPVTNELIKTELISVKIPIQIERNQIIGENEVSQIVVKTKNETKTVLDVISYGDHSAQALSVSSQTNKTSNFMADSKTVLTSDTLISNVDFSETETLENNIDIKEIPIVGSHLKIKEVPLVVNQIRIKEKKGHSIISNVVSTEVVDAEVPIVIEKVITEQKIPNLIPISIYKTKVSESF